MRWPPRVLLFELDVAVVAALGAALVCWQLGLLQDKPQDLEKIIERCMSEECHPVWRDLQAGRIVAGDAVEEVIHRTQPPRIEKFENVTILLYRGPGLSFTGVTIIARDGRLVTAAAGSCTWDKTFFDTWPQGESAAFWKRYAAHLEAQRQDKEGG